MIAGVIGILLGMVNAVIIYYFNIHSIIATIATLNIYYGILTVLSGGKWIYALPIWFREFAEIRVFTLTNPRGIEYGLSIITVIWLVLLVIAWIVLRFTVLGRGLYAIGGSPASPSAPGLISFDSKCLSIHSWG